LAENFGLENYRQQHADYLVWATSHRSFIFGVGTGRPDLGLCLGLSKAFGFGR